jgi:endonuclease YncB( thermonuclease family)
MRALQAWQTLRACWVPVALTAWRQAAARAKFAVAGRAALDQCRFWGKLDRTLTIRKTPMIRRLVFAALSAVAFHSIGSPHLWTGARQFVAAHAPAAHAPPAQAGEVFRVEKVLDGDTVILRGAPQRVRLANIDAPEMSHGYGKPGQPFAVQATKWMERAVEGKDVSLRCPDEDRYGRRVCVLFLNGQDVNKELVRQGLAWANTANPRYLRDRSVLDAQRQAQRERRGLWAQPHPTAPWLWRHGCWERRVCPGEL